MPQFKKLLRVLEKELALQERVLELLSRERAAIVKLNQERVQELTQEKERLLSEVSALESERRALMGALAAPAPTDAGAKDAGAKDASAPAATLSALLPQCRDALLEKELRSISDELKETVKSVRALNEQNGMLVKQSLGLIASTIAIMSARPEAALPTYGSKGTLSADEEDPAFTKRSSSFTRAA